MPRGQWHVDEATRADASPSDAPGPGGPTLVESFIVLTVLSWLILKAIPVLVGLVHPVESFAAGVDAGRRFETPAHETAVLVSPGPRPDGSPPPGTSLLLSSHAPFQFEGADPAKGILVRLLPRHDGPSFVLDPMGPVTVGRADPPWEAGAEVFIVPGRQVESPDHLAGGDHLRDWPAIGASEAARLAAEAAEVEAAARRSVETRRSADAIRQPHDPY